MITGGTNIGHLFDYAEASSPDTAGGTKATLIFGLPTPGEDPGLWPSGQASTSVLTPPTAAGTPSSLMNAQNPVGTAGASGVNLTNFFGGNTQSTTSGYLNTVEMRLSTGSGAGGSSANGQYWEDAIEIDPALGTWFEVSPAAAIPTLNTLTASPSPASTTSPITLTATVEGYDGTFPGGTVQFSDGATPIGSPVAGNASGVATTTGMLSAGPHTLTDVFTPTTPASYAGSTGTTSDSATAPATATHTVLTDSSDGFAGDDLSLMPQSPRAGRRSSTALSRSVTRRPRRQRFSEVDRSPARRGRTRLICRVVFRQVPTRSWPISHRTTQQPTVRPRQTRSSSC